MTDFIREEKEAKNLNVGDTFNVCWTPFNTGTFEDEGFEDENLNETIEGKELSTLLNGMFEVVKVDLKDDSVFLDLVEDYGITAKIRVPPESQFLIEYNNNCRSKYLEESGSKLTRVQIEMYKHDLQNNIRKLLKEFETQTGDRVLEVHGKFVKREGSFSGHEIELETKEMTQREKLEVTDVWNDIK